MRRLALSALVLALASPALAQTTDAPKPAAKAACRDVAGQPKACRKAPKKPGAGAGSASILRCRDVVSHRFTKCGGPTAEPVPAE